MRNPEITFRTPFFFFQSNQMADCTERTSWRATKHENIQLKFSPSHTFVNLFLLSHLAQKKSKSYIGNPHKDQNYFMFRIVKKKKKKESSQLWWLSIQTSTIHNILRKSTLDSFQQQQGTKVSWQSECNVKDNLLWSTHTYILCPIDEGRVDQQGNNSGTSNLIYDV